MHVNNDIYSQIQRFQNICGTIWQTFKTHQYKKNNVEITQILAIPALLYGCKKWTVQKKIEGRLKRQQKKNFLRLVVGYSLYDYKTNEQIRK